jgi:hypothetical protein
MIDKILDHGTRAEANLLQQYKEAENLKNLLSVWTGRTQQLEDELHGMFTSRALFDAFGVQLDLIGQIVGIAREGYDDETYRKFLLFKIGTNKSDGTAETVIELFRLVGGSDRVQLTNEGDGSFSLIFSTLNRPEWQAFLEEHMAEVAAAGVDISAFIEYAPEIAFAFAGDPLVDRGFGDALDSSVGGEFAGVV